MHTHTQINTLYNNKTHLKEHQVFIVKTTEQISFVSVCVVSQSNVSFIKVEELSIMIMTPCYIRGITVLRIFLYHFKIFFSTFFNISMNNESGIMVSVLTSHSIKICIFHIIYSLFLIFWFFTSFWYFHQLKNLLSKILADWVRDI